MKQTRNVCLALAITIAFAFVLRCGGDDEACSSDGDPCTSTGSPGICYGGACVQDVCVTAEGRQARGKFNPKDSCKVCDPTRSRIRWSPIVCKVQNDCALPTGTCDTSALSGACQGEECCVFKPVWDGQGTAPTCTHGTAKGTCDTVGRCTGVCDKDADCDTGVPCRKWTCEQSTRSCSSAPDEGGVCDFASTGDGVCVTSKCLKACKTDADCPTGSCGTNGYCVAEPPKKETGSPCAADAECKSTNCECVNSSCSQRVCALADCVCGYGTSGSCSSGMMQGAKDPEDCDSVNLSCHGLSVCNPN